jgi:hypothetical protein
MNMKALGIFLAILTMMILGFFAVGFTDSVVPPATNTTAGAQYANMTKAIDITSTGVHGTLLILVAAMALTAMLFMYQSLTKRR